MSRSRSGMVKLEAETGGENEIQKVDLNQTITEIHSNKKIQ